ncbi:amidohydrolase family protein [Sandaracinobacter sp. RS1-74]|uniref:amidohydrolase family protein n=1 Tax=Sandaracinobacteroides sayramensis TaxID=2913411 RepID=UPI001EDBCA25|nr:amidohydrolase family protein [Sandaracinobacteroides sayramensis]MCG2841930.1 amidohydrolase family protein [Sandaracinobacteroides sayramensis]
MRHIAGLVALLALSAPLVAGEENFAILFGGRTVGKLSASGEGATTRIVYDYKNNGRGPTIAETVTVDANGLPTSWTVKGNTTFGSKVEESFSFTNGVARWVDATGPGEAHVAAPALYVAQGASPFALGLYARALDKAGGALPALPGGQLKLEKIGGFELKGAGGALPVTAHSLSGIDLERQTLFLDGDKRLVAYATPHFIVVREGYEGEEARLRALVADWDTKRLAGHQQQLAHKPKGDLRIDNVRIFDPATLALTAPASVLVKGSRIAAIEAPGKRGRGETIVDGKGGTLLAGFHEMHAHLGQSDALLNLVNGITTVRDMGNDDAVLDRLVERMEAGELAGPRVVRSGFIEGKSKTNVQNGVVVDNQADAVKAVADAAKRGVFQIKIYSSIDSQWVPAMIAEAHRQGLKVAGHIPAFTTTDAMLEAGYDEITHSNQMMLNWVLKPEDDTRTLLRITALKRFADLDLDSAAPQKTLALMVRHKAAHDPTLIIMETAMRGRPGQLPPGAEAWAGHMPVGTQRDLKQPMLAIETPEDDAAYSKAFDVTRDFMRRLHEAGVLILPGTDMGGHFWYHRELELYTGIGMSNAEVLKRATYDSAKYMNRDDRFGAVKPGLVADLVLLPGDPVADINAIRQVAMVVKDGTVYFPTEAYERLGIKPFTGLPAVSGAGFAGR